MKDDELLVGCYSLEHYLSVYDARNYEKTNEIKWGDAASGNQGLIYSAKFWPTGSKLDNFIVAGSIGANDIKVFYY